LTFRLIKTHNGTDRELPNMRKFAFLLNVRWLLAFSFRSVSFRHEP